MSNKHDEAFDNEVEMLTKMGRFDLVGSPGNPPEHYAGVPGRKSIEPVVAFNSWGLDFVEGSICKYIIRHRKKGGLEDLMKAHHYLDILKKEYEE